MNANTGDIAWKAILSRNERLPGSKQLLGNVGSAGPITTAGSLLFIPANDSRLHAFHSKTGAELWQAKLNRAILATPITYQGRTVSSMWPWLQRML